MGVRMAWYVKQPAGHALHVCVCLMISVYVYVCVCVWLPRVSPLQVLLHSQPLPRRSPFSFHYSPKALAYQSLLYIQLCKGIYISYVYMVCSGWPHLAAPERRFPSGTLQDILGNEYVNLQQQVSVFFLSASNRVWPTVFGAFSVQSWIAVSLTPAYTAGSWTMGCWGASQWASQ